MYQEKGKVRKIEIDFPVGIELSTKHGMALAKLVRQICEDNCPKGYVMWPAGVGSKLSYMPITAEEEEARNKKGLSPIEFDESVFQIDCAIKVK